MTCNSHTSGRNFPLRLTPTPSPLSRKDAVWPTFRDADIWMQQHKHILDRATYLLDLYPTLAKRKTCGRFIEFTRRANSFGTSRSLDKRGTEISQRNKNCATDFSALPKITITEDFESDEVTDSARKQISRILICGDTTSGRWSSLVLSISSRFNVRMGHELETCLKEGLSPDNDVFIFLMDAETINSSSYLQQLKSATEVKLRVIGIREPHFLHRINHYNSQDRDLKTGSSAAAGDRLYTSRCSLTSPSTGIPEKSSCDFAKSNDVKLKQKKLPFFTGNNSASHVTHQVFSIARKRSNCSHRRSNRFRTPSSKYCLKGSSFPGCSSQPGAGIGPSSYILPSSQCKISKLRSSNPPALRPPSTQSGTNKNKPVLSKRIVEATNKLLHANFDTVLVYSRFIHNQSLKTILKAIGDSSHIDRNNLPATTTTKHERHIPESRATWVGPSNRGEVFVPDNNTKFSAKSLSAPASPTGTKAEPNFMHDPFWSKSHSTFSIDNQDAEQDLPKIPSTSSETVFIVYPPYRSRPGEEPKIVRWSSDNHMEIASSIGSRGFHDVDLSISPNQLDWSSDESY